MWTGTDAGSGTLTVYGSKSGSPGGQVSFWNGTVSVNPAGLAHPNLTTIALGGGAAPGSASPPPQSNYDSQVTEANALQWIGRGASAAFRWIKKNVKIDGPSAGFKYGEGRFLQVRIKNRIIFRIDKHSRIPGIKNPQWHIHLFPPSTRGEHGIVLPPNPR